MRDIFFGLGSDILKITFRDPSDGLRSGLATVYAGWPTKAILREIKDAAQYARSVGGTDMHIELMCACGSGEVVFQRIFNLLIGNGFRWIGGDCFETTLKEA